MEAGLYLMIVLVAGAVIGWIPGVVAFGRRHRNAGAIMACGMLGVLFFPAWIAALVWSLTNDVEPGRSRGRSRRRRRRLSPMVDDAADALDDLAE